ncbi:MAG: hypothetical protein K5656_09485 [Lachnospiraceae bacterium]|nr:hypothetical protein [Lachnospiraceae bacterium]
MKNKIIVLIFVMMLAAISVATFGLPDREFSEIENRYLELKPELSFKSLVDGSYEEKFEKYMADQISGKDTFVSIKSDMEYLTHKQGANGVYFGKDGKYVKAYDPNYRQYDENLQFIDSYMDYYKDKYPIAMLLAPNVQTVYTDVLADNIYMADAETDFELAYKKFKDVVYVNPTDTLREHKSEDIYFNTDHHWTMRGAYYAYTELAKELGITPNPLIMYSDEIVSEDFYGSLYSKAPLSFAKPDAIEVLSNPAGNYRVTFEDGTRMNSLFAGSKLHTKDKYTYFLDGNHPFITIESNAGSGKKALVFKDSYSHALLPFLADHYDKIDVVDLRYYHEDVKELTESGNYDQIIMIYNLDFMTSDSNFIWMNVK